MRNLKNEVELISEIIGSVESTAIGDVNESTMSSTVAQRPSMGFPRRETGFVKIFRFGAILHLLSRLIASPTVTCTTTDVTTAYLPGTYTRTIVIHSSIPFRDDCIDPSDASDICLPPTKTTLSTRLICRSTDSLGS